MEKTTKKMMDMDSEFISPEELAIRWRCSRSTVDRIANREKMSRLYLGEGKNGIVRYLRTEVATYEERRLVRPK